jgi:hypothetical protein
MGSIKGQKREEIGKLRFPISSLFCPTHKLCSGIYRSLSEVSQQAQAQLMNEVEGMP